MPAALVSAAPPGAAGRGPPPEVASRVEQWQLLEKQVAGVEEGPLSKSELKRRIRALEKEKQRREREEAKLAAGKLNALTEQQDFFPDEPLLASTSTASSSSARCTLLGFTRKTEGAAPEPILGPDKFLGGALAPDGKVYCMPGHATGVVRIDGETNRVERLDSWVVAGDGVSAGGELKGIYKWLRGAVSVDGCVYGIPSHADTLLRIDPTSERIDLLPLPERLRGLKWKWHGGAVAPDGCIYGVPCGADCVLKIAFEKVEKEEEGVPVEGNPLGLVANGYRVVLSTFGCPKLLAGEGKWYGGVLVPKDGCIYGIPQNAERVLKIIPHEGRVELIGPNLGRGGWKWHGAVLSRKDGCLYAIPNHTSCVLKIDPSKYVSAGDDAGADGGGAPVLLSGDNSILREDARDRDGYQGVFLYNGHAAAEGSNAGVLDPPGHRPEGKYKYLGGAEDPVTGDIYCMPSDADRVLRIRPQFVQDEVAQGSAESDKTEQVLESGVPMLSLHGQSFAGASKEQNKWQNGFFCKSDKCIYGIPLKADAVLRIRTELTDSASDQSVELVRIPNERAAAGNNKWEGGVMDKKGRMFCMPLLCKAVLRIDGAAADGDGGVASGAGL